MPQQVRGVIARVKGAPVEIATITLPDETRVHTGHGDGTTIGAEAPHLAEWIARGH